MNPKNVIKNILADKRPEPYEKSYKLKYACHECGEYGNDCGCDYK